MTFPSLVLVAALVAGCAGHTADRSRHPAAQSPVGIGFVLPSVPADARGISLECELQVVAPASIVAKLIIHNEGSGSIATLARGMAMPAVVATEQPSARWFRYGDFTHWEGPPILTEREILVIPTGGTEVVWMPMQVEDSDGTPRTLYGAADLSKPMPTGCLLPYWLWDGVPFQRRSPDGMVGSGTILFHAFVQS